MKVWHSQLAFPGVLMVRLLVILACRMNSVRLGSAHFLQFLKKNMKYPVTWTEDIFAG